MKKYAIHPGWVKSRNDVDEHFINFSNLCRLYGLNPSECIHWSDRAGLSETDWLKYIHLYPKYDGNYSLGQKYD